jgi:hypothetical protein
MREVAAKFQFANAYFNEWYDMSPKTFWDNIYPLQLDESWLKAYLEDMIDLFRRDIPQAQSDELREKLIYSGHDFLRAIRTRCVALGIDVDGIDFNPCFSFRDAVARAQG